MCPFECIFSLSQIEKVFPKVLSENLSHYNAETDEATSVLALAYQESMAHFSEKLQVSSLISH